MYALHAVIEHRGGSQGGHYVTYRRVPSLVLAAAGRQTAAPAPGDPHWAVASDSSVRPVDAAEVRDAEAYLLVYQLQCATATELVGTALNTKAVSCQEACADSVVAASDGLVFGDDADDWLETDPKVLLQQSLGVVSEDSFTRTRAVCCFPTE